MKNKLIEIVGIPGCGKSTFLKEVKLKYPDLISLNFSDLINTFSENSPEIKLRDCVNKSVEYLIQKQPAVFATHSIYRTDKEIYSIDIASEIDLNCLSYIQIISPIQEIKDRIKKDNASRYRIRDYSDLELDFMQKVSREATQYMAKRLNCQYYEIENTSENFKQSIDQFIQIIRRSLI